MKLGLFSDAHYSSAEVTCDCRQNNRSLEKMKEAYRIFEEAGCDLVVCLGDLTDTEDTYEKECANLLACASVMDASSVPTLCVMGNHDAFVFETDDFYRMLGETHRPQPVQTGEVTLLFLDACHYRSGVHYAPGGEDWTDTFYPYAEELREKLSTLTGDVYVFMHQNIDALVPGDHRLYNADLLCKIFAESGVVRGAVQGHYHVGARNETDGVTYLTLPALCEHDTRDAVVILDI